MKKLFTFVIFTLSTCIIIAQSLNSTFSKELKVDSKYWGLHNFKSGDTVTIHGFTKGSYLNDNLFAIETKDYIEIIECADIPFNVTEKELKKLPKTTNSKFKTLFNSKQEELLLQKKSEYKNQALNGGIWLISKDSHYFTPSIKDVSKGDTIHILGYKKGYTDYQYLLYTDKDAGTFKSYSDVLPSSINTLLLPSVDDTDMKIAIKQKKNEIEQKRKDEKLRYQKDALNGEVKGVIDYLASFRTDDFKSSPFSSGDTVSIVGYSKKDYRYYYAMFSDKGSGVFCTSYDKPFKNQEHIKIGMLPSTNNEEVLNVLAKKQEIADSLLEIEKEKVFQELKESKISLMEVLKKVEPVMISVDSWSSNSVGGIEVNISVSNCSATQTIKYISFQGYFTNAVGDKVRNEIGGGTIWKARGVGPIGPRPTTLDNFDERYDNYKGYYEFDNLTFYSQTAQYFHLSTVTIQYMSGKTITLTGESLKKHVIYK